MGPYHKIKTVFERDPDTNYKTLLLGKWATPEFEFLHRMKWWFTEKIDGTNIRVNWDGESIRYGGRTERAQIPTRLLDALADTFTPDKFLGEFETVTLYGEGFGPSIQSGGNYRDDVGFILFDVKIGDMWLERPNVEDIAGKLGIPLAPFIATGSLGKAVEMVQGGLLSTFGDFPAEGLVMRPEVELFDRRGGRIISKVKGKDFA